MKRISCCARSCFFCIADAPQSPARGQTVQGHRKKRLLPLSRFHRTKRSDRSADPAACTSNEDKRESGAAISSEPVSAPTESNAPASEETKQPPVLPEKPEETESPTKEPSAPAITEPKPTPEPEPAFDIEHWISYAKSTAVSLGLTLDSSATDCWDNPIIAKQSTWSRHQLPSEQICEGRGDNRCLVLVRVHRHRQLPDLYRVRISINKSIHRNEHRGSTVLFSCLEGGQNE